MTPLSECYIPSPKNIRKALTKQFSDRVSAKSEEYILPPSVKLMMEALWQIAEISYDFPKNAGCFMSKLESGEYRLAFIYEVDNKKDWDDDYTDPDYEDDVADYLGKIITVAPDGVDINIDDSVVTFKNKKTLYNLICNMINDEENFDLVQPEEMATTIPVSMPENESRAYLKGKHETYLRRGIEEDPDMLLMYSPLKPYTNHGSYLSESAMACESPFIVNIGQIRALLVLEGEENILEPEVAQKGYYTFGIH